jgi:hypothetical protein
MSALSHRDALAELLLPMLTAGMMFQAHCITLSAMHGLKIMYSTVALLGRVMHLHGCQAKV